MWSIHLYGKYYEESIQTSLLSIQIHKYKNITKFPLNYCKATRLLDCTNLTPCILPVAEVKTFTISSTVDSDSYLTNLRLLPISQIPFSSSNRKAEHPGVFTQSDEHWIEVLKINNRPKMDFKILTLNLCLGLQREKKLVKKIFILKTLIYYVCYSSMTYNL